MKTKIKEVQDYFRNKLRAGDFTIINRGEHVTKVSIEGHIFNLWIANGERALELYYGQYNFIHFELSDDDQQEIWPLLTHKNN